VTSMGASAPLRSVRCQRRTLRGARRCALHIMTDADAVVVLAATGDADGGFGLCVAGGEDVQHVPGALVTRIFARG
jgi:hypothetical protein